MAVDTAPARTAVPAAVLAPHRGNGRGNPQIVTMRTTTYLAGLLEGQALAQEVMTSAERIQTAAAIGSRQLVVAEAGRLGVRATAALGELRRLAAGFEE